MTNNKSPIIKSYIFLVLLLMLISLLVFVNVYGSKNIPLVYEVKPNNTSGEFLDFSDVKNLEYTEISAYGEKVTQIKTTTNNIYDVKAVLTDENYCDLYGMELIEGSFFDYDMVDGKSNYVVISENLSKKISPIACSLGKEIYIDDFSYIIIGVYKSRDSFWGSLSSDDSERIYIPHTSYPDSLDMMVTAISIKNNDKAVSVVDSIKIKHPEILGNIIEIDYKEMRTYSTQFVSLLINIIRLITIVLVLKLLYKIASGYVRELRRHREEYFLGRLLIHNKKYIILLFVSFAIFVPLVVYLCKNLSLEIAMSNNFMPRENLFDLSHYKDKVIDFFINSNSTYMEGYLFYYRLVFRTLFVSIVLSLFIYPCMVLFISKLKRFSNKRWTLAVEMLAYMFVLLIVTVTIKSSMKTVYLRSATGVLIHLVLLSIVIFLGALRENYINKIV